MTDTAQGPPQHLRDLRAAIDAMHGQIERMERLHSAMMVEWAAVAAMRSPNRGPLDSSPPPVVE